MTTMARSYDSVYDRSGAIEILKWLGLVAMLTDHIGKWVLGSPVFWTEHVGALAFPLFTVALTAALADHPHTGWVHRKMLFWALAAQVLGMLVRDPVPLNILFTFLLGLLAFQAEREHGFFAFLSFLALGVFVEYGPFGVLFVYGMRAAFFYRQPIYHVLSVISLLTFAPWNSGTHMAIVALPLAWLVISLHPTFPRVRGFFYKVYAFQWLFIWFAAGLVALSRGLLPYATNGVN